MMRKSNGSITESNSLWRSPRYKTLTWKARSTRKKKGQLHRPPPLLFPFWKLQRKIHRMIQILAPLCPAFPPPPPRKENRASWASSLSYVSPCSLSPQPFSRLHLFYLSAKCDLGKSRPMWEPKKLLIVATPRREVLGPKDGGKRKANPKLRS